ncbi:MAG: PAS domain-containing protein [Methanomicrobiaceae archaeon]|nr:PAS domain-containing protein [Methanomicrobiaceae archaeon]
MDKDANRVIYKPLTSELSQSACENLRAMLENPVVSQSVAGGSISDVSCIQKLANVFAFSSEKVFLVSYPSGEIIYINPIVLDKMIKSGIDPSKKRITDYFSLKGPDGSPLLQEEAYVGAFLVNNGTYEQMELRAVDVSDGDLSLILVYVKNISEVKKSERMLRESEIQHRTTLNAIRDGVVVVNKGMEIVICNKSFEDITTDKGPCELIVGKKLSDVSPYLTGKLGLEYRYIFQSGESLDTIIKVRNERSLKYYEVIKSPVFDEGEVIQVVTIIRDRTKNHHLEQLKKDAFFQIEKNMEQFAILNDYIRNPLQAIMGLADLHGGDMGEKIISQALEINSIVTKLDAGWIESEKVRDMLSKHYGIKLKRRPNVESPIGMLQTNDLY